MQLQDRSRVNMLACQYAKETLSWCYKATGRSYNALVITWLVVRCADQDPCTKHFVFTVALSLNRCINGNPMGQQACKQAE